MRIVLLVFILILIQDTAFSQKRISARKVAKHVSKKNTSKRKGTIIWSLDTIFNKGQAYAILTKKKMMPHHEYRLYSLNRKELIFIQTVGNMDGREYYSFNFVDNRKRAYPEKYVTFDIVKEVVAFDLVKGDSINPFGLIKFLKKYPPKKSSNTVEEKDINIYSTVKRNRDEKIYFTDGEIYQDYEIIGTYKITDEITRVYLLNNITAAEIHKKDEDGLHSIHTLKDQKIKNLKFEKGNELRSLFVYLADNGYI